ncbi:MAG: hypothetical protein ACXWPI_16300 [Ktedonobacterales bacterium]
MQDKEQREYEELIEQMGTFEWMHPKASIGEIAEEFALTYDDAETALQEYRKRHTARRYVIGQRVFFFSPHGGWATIKAIPAPDTYTIRLEITREPVTVQAWQLENEVNVARFQ